MEYNADTVGLIGLKNEFKLLHIPFLVVNDVYGIMCLVGSSGTGKTTLIKRIGKLNELATGGKCGVFSADKARYEDFIGCPIPVEDSGEMKIYPMPNSVSQMELLLIDEINRASYDNQEKWLSLCATREIDGCRTKCKYIYAAMNPILTDGKEVYEGVQPLDKALGERVMGLVEIPSFHKLPAAARKDIIMQASKQVSWEPTDKLIDSHIGYIKRARENYEEAKNKYTEIVADYIDNIHLDLRKETKNSVAIEARRAQFLLTNILATYALDKVESKADIQISALNALVNSFPNCLWEQVINREALKAAHTKSSNLLSLNNTKNRSASNYDGIERPLQEIRDIINNKEIVPTKEQLSKLINNNIPNKDEDPINYYIYACGIMLALDYDIGNNNFTQPIMKEQELSRLAKIFTEVVSSDDYKKLTDIEKHLREYNELPSNYKLPVYIMTSKDKDSMEVFKRLLRYDVGRCSLVISNLNISDINDIQDTVMIIDKLSKVMKVISDLKARVKTKTK